MSVKRPSNKTAITVQYPELVAARGANKRAPRVHLAPQASRPPSALRVALMMFQELNISA